jgi:hypothetical protein
VSGTLVLSIFPYRLPPDLPPSQQLPFSTANRESEERRKLDHQPFLNHLRAAAASRAALMPGSKATRSCRAPRLGPFLAPHRCSGHSGRPAALSRPTNGTAKPQERAPEFWMASGVGLRTVVVAKSSIFAGTDVSQGAVAGLAQLFQSVSSGWLTPAV